jgi:hypothetical protein
VFDPHPTTAAPAAQQQEVAVAASFLDHLRSVDQPGRRQHEAMTRLFGESSEQFHRRLAAEEAEENRDRRERLARREPSFHSVNVGIDDTSRRNRPW